VAKFRLRNAAGALLTLDGPALPLNTWSHVVGTFDGTTMRIYVNAALSSSAAAVVRSPGAAVRRSSVGSVRASIPSRARSMRSRCSHSRSQRSACARITRAVARRCGFPRPRPAAGSQRATAQASATESDPDTTNNTLNLDSTISAPRADLALSGTVAPEPAAIGDTLTYQYALTNNGPARATAVTLVVTLAAGLSAGAATVSQGSCSTTGQTVSCALGVLEAGITAGLLSDRPAGFWRLGDAATSSVAADSSGNGLSGVYDPGVLRGQPGAISGDTAAAFSGSSR